MHVTRLKSSIPPRLSRNGMERNGHKLLWNAFYAFLAGFARLLNQTEAGSQKLGPTQRTLVERSFRHLRYLCASATASS